MFEAADIVTLCIFKSTPQNIAKYSSSCKSPNCMALSDRKGDVFKSYTVKKSTRAAISGSVHLLKNYRKYKQVIDVGAALKETRGGTCLSQLSQLPADFMIDEEGIIVDLCRYETMNDCMPFDRLEQFIPKEKRCNCNKQDCIVPRCRENYQEIKRESERMLFMG